MTARASVAMAAALTILVAGGCGAVNDETYTKLERQRDDVLGWARDLSSVAEATLAASPEDATQSYDGVARSGVSDRFKSYKYDIQARFITEQQDPLAALSDDLASYDPTLTTSNALRLSHGELTAFFQTYPKGPGRVGMFVEGPAIEIDHDQIRDWDGFVVGEPVDLQ
ncbi:hypothetical protein ACIRON_06810 [Nocardioides sp. NPDC101246]|uniref:hypothetical protein n=1 Tax=Nocardioides sp. NPDC101246 TaxID=3364336 RepID=UPI0037F61AAC